jgi:hypothetical protein
MALRFEYIFELISSLNFLEILNHVGDCIIPISPRTSNSPWSPANILGPARNGTAAPAGGNERQKIR